jgi:hypothetical protein
MRTEDVAVKREALALMEEAGAFEYTRRVIAQLMCATELRAGACRADVSHAHRDQTLLHIRALGGNEKLETLVRMLCHGVVPETPVPGGTAVAQTCEGTGAAVDNGVKATV